MIQAAVVSGTTHNITIHNVGAKSHAGCTCGWMFPLRPRSVTARAYEAHLDEATRASEKARRGHRTEVVR